MENNENDSEINYKIEPQHTCIHYLHIANANWGKKLNRYVSLHKLGWLKRKKKKKSGIRKVNE